MPLFFSQVLEKLASRKLWVTLLTLAAVLLGANQADGVDPHRVGTIVSASLGGLYIIMQGLIDRVRAKAVTVVATTSPDVQETLKRLETLIKSMAIERDADKAREAGNPSRTAVGASLLAVLLLASTPFVYGGCSHNERPACSELTLAQLNGVYVKELVESCKGRTLDECDEAAAIDAAHNQRLKEWVECR